LLYNLPPQLLIILAFSLIFALTFHEFGHAFVAYLCGDNTAKIYGRMSLNPLVHLDLIGSLMVIFVGFGYAKPVPVNPNNYRYKNSDFYIALAGPFVNLLLGLGGSLLLSFLATNNFSNFFSFPILEFLYLFILINFNLCLFNLIPLGPLDGNSVLPHFLPSKLKFHFEILNKQYGYQALMVLILISILIPNFNIFSWISNISKRMIAILI